VTFEQLQEQSNRTLHAFLQTEITLGLTFVKRAEFERKNGNDQHFQKCKVNAILAAKTIERFKERLATNEKREIETSATELHTAIAAL